MNIVDVINKKRLGNELTYDELVFAFDGYLKKEIPDYQMASLLMAITIKGLNLNETVNLTDIFIKSGEVYHFDKPVCDKHSTGGIGDTVSLIICPILAALNIPIVKMSGRGLGITGGTIDKLESIPGFKTNLSKEEVYSGLEKCNIALTSQTDNLVPLDKVIYALRDVTGTTDSIPLIASSIMSKKIASGAKYIVIDIKCGEGALIKSNEDALKLSDWLISIGNHYNVIVKTIISSMDEPLSDVVGNSLEVLEAIEVLKGKETKLTETSLEVAATLISMYEDISYDDAYDKAHGTLKDYSAYNAFKKWIDTQGGDLSKLKVSDHVFTLKSNSSGIVDKVSALACGKLALKLGVGRITKDSSINYETGIKLVKKKGDEVNKGEVLAYIYAPNDNLNLAKEYLNIYSIIS